MAVFGPIVYPLFESLTIDFFSSMGRNTKKNIYEMGEYVFGKEETSS